MTDLEQEQRIMSRLIAILLALAVTIPIFLKNSRSASSVAPAVFVPCSSHEKIICIDGDVRHPGIYSTSANFVTDSVIALAEPYRSVHISKFKGSKNVMLLTGSVIHLVNKPNKTSSLSLGEISTAQRMILGIPLDMKTMNASDFERLPGIGPVLAGRIISYRQLCDGNMRPPDLLLIEGIGEKKYAVLKKYF